MLDSFNKKEVHSEKSKATKPLYKLILSQVTNANARDMIE